MKKSIIYNTLSIAILLAFFVTTQGCKTANEPNPEPPIVNKVVTVLPDKEVKVYFGAEHNWHEQDDPLNYSKWSYVRENADGYYANFISMWIMFYQDKTALPPVSCSDMRKAFKKGGVFFETSLETSVNSGANGFNNDSTDRRSLILLTNAGFKVDYTSLNYGVTADRVTLLRTYKGTRKCLCLSAPWKYGGNIISDAATANKQQRINILTTDGMQTDGPLGFWFNNGGGMREGSYSCVKYVWKYKLEAAVMLAPFKASIPGYEAENDFLNVSKQCVLGHEDNNAAPEIWTIWTYQSPAGLALFPESAVNADGEVYAPNTKAGVAYWLLKHLKNFPKLTCNETGKVNNDVTVTLTNDSVVDVKLTKDVQYSMPITISNDNQPQIEITPVIRAILNEAANDWIISFWVGTKDVTDKVIYNGGLNCIDTYRLTKTNRLTLKMLIKSRSTVASPAPLTINLQSMSNISNTKNKQNFKITVNPL
jgi:hypothetical protein